MWNYSSEEEALVDVLRLSKGMTYKAAIAGLNLGGGKAVIIGDPNYENIQECKLDCPPNVVYNLYYPHFSGDADFDSLIVERFKPNDEVDHEDNHIIYYVDEDLEPETEYSYKIEAIAHYIKGFEEDICYEPYDGYGDDYRDYWDPDAGEIGICFGERLSLRGTSNPEIESISYSTTCDSIAWYQDIDGDGHTDLLTATGVRDNMIMLLGEGNGSFSEPFDFSGGLNVGSLTAVVKQIWSVNGKQRIWSVNGFGASTKK